MFPKKLKLLMILAVSVMLMQAFQASAQIAKYRSYYRQTDVIGNTLYVNYDIHSSLGYDERSSYNQSAGFSLGFESAPFGESTVGQMVNGFINAGMMNRMHAPNTINANIGDKNSFFNGDAGLRVGCVFPTSLPYLSIRPHFDFSLNYRVTNPNDDALATKAALKFDVIFSNPYANSFLQGVKEVIEIGPYMDTRMNSSSWGGMIGRRIDLNFRLAFNLDSE